MGGGNKVIEKMKRSLSEWSLFEKMWITLFTGVTVYLYFAFQDSVLGLVSSVAGMLCVVLVAKGKISNYFFGIIQTVTYGYIAFGYGLYGESMLNWLFYFPLQFVGIWMWMKHRKSKEEAERSEERRVGKEGRRGGVVGRARQPRRR